MIAVHVLQCAVLCNYVASAWLLDGILQLVLIYLLLGFLVQTYL